MPEKQYLTDSQIINIHRLRFSGLPYDQIREQTGHCLTTIHNHCTGRHVYHSGLAAKINRYKRPSTLQPKPIPSDWVSIREASLLIPMNPSVSTIRDRIRSGSLKTHKISGIHATRLDWIDDHIAKRFGDIPEGVSIMHHDLDLCLLDDPPKSFFESLPAFRIQQRKASRLFDVNKACVAYGLRIEIPAIVHSRVARALTFGARFVLIHEGMFA